MGQVSPFCAHPQGEESEESVLRMGLGLAVSGPAGWAPARKKGRWGSCSTAGSFASYLHIE